MNCTLYHLTNAERVEAILREGFKDQPGNHGTDDELSGVWLSNRPLDSNEVGGPDENLIILLVTFSVPLSELADYEWVEEGRDHREWLIPADVIAKLATVERCVKPASAMR